MLYTPDTRIIEPKMNMSRYNHPWVQFTNRRRRVSAAEESPYYPVGADCVLYHAYWDGTATDHSLYGHDGTVAGPSFGEYGLTFDGIDDYVWATPTSVLQPGTHDIAMYAWIYLEYTTTASGAIMGMEIPASSYRYYVALLNSGTAPAAMRYKFVGDTYYNAAWGSFPRYTWIFAGWEVDRDVGGYGYNSEVRSDAVGTTDAGDYTDGTKFNIGCILPTLYHLWGKIGEVYAFNPIPSSASVTAIYNATKLRYGL